MRENLIHDDPRDPTYLKGGDRPHLAQMPEHRNHRVQENEFEVHHFVGRRHFEEPPGGDGNGAAAALRQPFPESGGRDVALADPGLGEDREPTRRVRAAGEARRASKLGPGEGPGEWRRPDISAEDAREWMARDPLSRASDSTLQRPQRAAGEGRRRSQLGPGDGPDFWKAPGGELPEERRDVRLAGAAKGILHQNPNSYNPFGLH